MKRYTSFAIGVLLLLALAPSTIHAQFGCDIRVIYGCHQAIGAHVAVEWEEGGAAGSLHAGCLVCGDAENGCHGCEPEFAAMLDVMDGSNIERLMEAATAGAPYLALNRPRRALQMLSCEGDAVVGSINLTAEQFVAFDRVLALRETVARARTLGFLTSLD